MIGIYRSFLILFLLSVPTETYAGGCDCKSEVGNASASTTDSCSKEWKNEHCTLRESGTTLRAVKQLDLLASLSSSPRFQDAVVEYQSVELKLTEIDDLGGIIEFGPVSEFYLSGPPDVSVEGRLSGDVPPTWVAWHVLDATLPGFDVEFVRSSVQSALLAGTGVFEEGIKTAVAIESEDFVVYGAGCFKFGSSSRYFLLDMNVIGLGCPSDFDGGF